MASGEVHLRANLLFLGAACGVTLLAAPEYLAPVAVGATVGVIITPDFDIDGRTITEQSILAIPVLGILFMQSWYGYALLARHRGISHGIFLGTPTRVFWSCLVLLFWYVFFVGLLYVCQWWTLLDWLPKPREYVFNPTNVLIVYVLWWAQDIVHYILDL